MKKGGKKGMGVGLIAALALAIALAGSGCTFSPQTARQVASGVSVQQVRIDAKQWDFTPGEVRVKLGTPVELVFTSLDVDHGIEFSDLDVPMERVPAGRTVTIRFIPARLGVYHFNCAVLCGIGHDRMRGTLVIE